MPNKANFTLNQISYKYSIVNTFSDNDYYAFGSLMPGRQYSSGTGYRYGFNGKENDNEVKGIGNQQDYGMRIYDPRLGKFLSIDPLTKSYAMLTPYQFASNRVIDGIDLDGEEFKTVTGQLTNINPNLPLSNAEITYTNTLLTNTNGAINLVNPNANLTPGGQNYTALSQNVFNNTFGNNPEKSYQSSACSGSVSPALYDPVNNTSALNSGILVNGSLSPAIHNALIQIQINNGANYLSDEMNNGMFGNLTVSDINRGLNTMPSVINATNQVAQNGFQDAVFTSVSGSNSCESNLVTTLISTDNTTSTAFVEAKISNVNQSCRIPHMDWSSISAAGSNYVPRPVPQGTANTNPQSLTQTYNNNGNTPADRTILK